VTFVTRTRIRVHLLNVPSDSSTHIVEAIWPTSSVACRTETGPGSVLPLRTFIQETLRRSRTSYSTLQVALYYLVLIKPHVPEHDFTMEQPDDCHASRALQCGRRMFLAALILASKYLQDRNYSARAWSKISGLATQEINQNEMAFLAAVRWKLHITDELYNRWTDCVMTFTPPQPPSPGAGCQRLYDEQCESFRNIILKLTPELDNIEDKGICTPTSSRSRDFPVISPIPRRISSVQSLRSPLGFDASELTPTPKSISAPNILEPAINIAPLPSLGYLPTPRLTPQTSGFGTPAVNAVPSLLGFSRGSSMGFALAHASSVTGAKSVDRWPVSTSPSPVYLGRRSSLANSVSTASSPESMVSDSSRISRSSSISSASSVVSAPALKLDVVARCRFAKQQCSEKFSLGPTILSVPEDFEHCLSSSPEPMYTGPVCKAVDISMDTPLARREREMGDDEAARTLQALRKQSSQSSLKRSRSSSVADNSMHDQVRDLLSAPVGKQGNWSGDLVRPRLGARAGSLGNLQVPVTTHNSRKRVCCASESQQTPETGILYHPSMHGMSGPGMWAGVLS
jgi:PHO85 cyclin-5